jgi:hypothetical protein
MSSGAFLVHPFQPRSIRQLRKPRGTFTIQNVQPGDYWLSARRTGFLETQYGSKSRYQRVSTISLRPGQQLTNISIQLTPQSVIAGKVVDPDGDPVDRAQVQLIGRFWWGGKLRYSPCASATTNDRGEYRLSGLEPGRYYLVAQRMPFNEDPPSSGGEPVRRSLQTF